MIFTNAFALSSVLTPAFAISFIFIFHFSLQVVLQGNTIRSLRPPYLLFLWLLLTFSFLAMSDSNKATNHWLLWTFPFFSYYYVFKNELFRLFTLSEIKNKVFKVISYTTLFACSFCIIEFCSTNFLSIDLSFIPRGLVKEYSPYDAGFFRARSFAEESGQFSFYVELLGPLSVFWINKNFKFPFKLIALAIIILGLMATMSGVGLLLLGVYIFLFFNSHLSRKRTSSTTKAKLLVYAFGIVYLIGVYYSDGFSTIFGLITIKIDPDNFSYLDRSGRFYAIEKLSGVAYLIGYGPAAFSTLDVNSLISFYLGVLMNTGVIGVLLLSLFCFSKYRIIKKIKDIDCRFALKCSFLFACFHLIFIDTIYVPWFWVILALIDVIYLKETSHFHDT